MIKQGLNILIHPATLSLLISCIIIYLLPPVFERYKAIRVKYTKENVKTIITYYDLDNDGYSEKILFMETNTNKPSILIKTGGKVIGKQLYFDGSFLKNQFYIFGNYNNDSLNEVYVFTYHNDSIFIHGIDPFNKEEEYFIKKFIDKNRLDIKLYKYDVLDCRNSDLDNDNYNEIVFAINAGLSVYPRNIYAYNIAKDTVYKSPESGSFILEPIAFDINGDSIDEFTFESFASGNWKGFYPNEIISYSDQYAWLMVLDKNLNFLFDPKGFKGPKITLQVLPFRQDGKTYLVLFQKNFGIEDINNALYLYNNKGEELQKRILGDFSKLENASLVSRDITQRDDLFLIYGDGKTEQLNVNLQTVNILQIDKITDGKPIRIDIDLDGVDEFLFRGENMQELILTRNDFSHPVILETPNDLSGSRYYSVIKRRDISPQLFIQFGSDSFIFDYFKNPLYYFKYAVYAGIFAGVYLLIFLIYKIQQIRAQHKYETEKKIAELQLKYVKTQTDPHFTLNIINSLGTLFYKNDPDKANYIFGKYAQMLKNTILRSDDISISLSEEIDYVENFLELEKFRFNNKFDYKIQIAKNVNQKNKIPKMLLHTFVQNAIKHGIRHLETKGKLNISLKASNNNYIFIITDNGVGRVKAKEYSKFSTGKGLKILDQMLGLYLKLEGVKIKYDIVDLYDNLGNQAGTKVVINVPFKINVSQGKIKNIIG